MHKTIIFIISVLSALAANAQSLSGVVKDGESDELIPGANVYWSATTIGTSTDDKGRFQIDAPPSFPHSLVISFVGYTNDTIPIADLSNFVSVSLSASLLIKEHVVNANQSAFTMSTMDKLNTEHINRGVLRKAACCNLSESFETSASVDVVLNDAITGTRKIQMLGLEGIYVQNLFEGIPFSRGLGNVLGFDQIPGPWISSVQLTKGIGTVRNGYESMTGQINLEFLKPSEEALFLDIFANHQSRVEGNAIWAQPINDRWSTALFVNATSQKKVIDNNDDGFLDMPLRTGVNLMNRWKYTGDFVRSQLMLRYVQEERISGQVNYNYSDDFGGTNAYGFGLDVNHYEALWKMGLLAKEREDQSIGFKASFARTVVDSYFGNNQYNGVQENARFIATTTTKFSEFSDHRIDVSGEFMYDGYNESYIDSAFSRTERVPGVSLEYTYTRPRLSLILGARADFHNLYGTQYSPRAHVKYNLKALSTIRFAIGSGFRSANVFADQLGFLASSRTVRVLHTPEAEKSWNTGLSYLNKFQLFGREAVFNIDYYYTQFQNQLVVDRDYDARQLLFYNLDGNSNAHSFQADFQSEIAKGLALKLSYKYQKVQTDYLSGTLDKPMVPEHRVLVNLGYTSPNGKWYIDATSNYYGVSRLPSTANNPEEFQIASKSKAYLIFNSQITRIMGDLEIYAGAENIGNFIQKDAIIDPENPFGTYFDATMIYGPLNGRTFYMGARYKLNLKNKNK